MRHDTHIYIIGILLSVMQSFSCYSQVSIRWTPKASVELGIVNEDKGAVNRRFSAVNTGNDSWQVVRGYTSCGCTTVKLEQERVVRSGDSTIVEVRFDPKGKAGPFREVVTVQLSDGEDVHNEKITLTGEVRRSMQSLSAQFPVSLGEVRISAAKLDFGELRRGTEGKRHLALCNMGETRKKVTLSFSSSLLATETRETSVTIEPEETLSLPVVWNGKEETRWGGQSEVLSIRTESGDKTEVQLLAVLLPEVPKSTEKTSQLQVARRIDLAQQSQNEKTVQRIALQNTGSATLQILRVYSDQEGIRVKTSFPLQIESGKKREIEVEVFPDASPEIPITIISNDVKRPRQTVRLIKK